MNGDGATGEPDAETGREDARADARADAACERGRGDATAATYAAPARSRTAPGVPLSERPFTPYDALLYALTVLAWSASWYALKINAAGEVSPPVAITWRFALAAAIMFAWVAFAGGRLRFGRRWHGAFAALGVLIFSSNFILFYYASTLLVSGLLAVVFSLASIVNLALGTLRGDLAELRRWLGAVLGASGIALLYWPELARGAPGAIGLALCVGGTLSFCLGNLVSQRLQAAAVPVLSASAWGMAYGAAWSAAVAAVAGLPFVVDTSAPFVGSLLFLVLVSTILAFWAYLTLVGRIGAGRAAYATVMFPIVALAISTRVEGYLWNASSIGGIALALLGNLFVLRGGRSRATARRGR